MTWAQIGNLAVVITLCGVLWRIGEFIHRGYQFCVRLEKHMQSIELKLDWALENLIPELSKLREKV